MLPHKIVSHLAVFISLFVFEIGTLDWIDHRTPVEPLHPLSQALAPQRLRQNGPTLVAERVHPAGRRVAVTIDDLPASALVDEQTCNREHLREINERLLRHLTLHQVPAIGFVNEGRPFCELSAEPFVEHVLSLWLDAGLELGNHTYSHGSLERLPVEEFMADVIRGEQITRRLLAEHGQQLRYFRHPYLDTGTDEDTQTAFERFLSEHGYITAPVTIDNDEWIFAGVYSKALSRGDSASMERIGQAYLTYMEEVFTFYEDFSEDLLGYELPQVLLIHANSLNADYFSRLAEMMLHRGYEFVTLETALRDPAYERGDTYTGPRGLSWLQRWLVADGKETLQEPAVPVWIREAMRN